MSAHEEQMEEMQFLLDKRTKEVERVMTILLWEKNNSLVWIIYIHCRAINWDDKDSNKQMTLMQCIMLGGMISNAYMDKKLT